MSLFIRGFGFVSGDSAHVIKLCVRSHVSQMGHAVRQGKKSSDGSNVPNILSVKTMSLERSEMFLCYRFTLANRQGKVQHGRLAVAYIGNPVIYCNLWVQMVPKAIINLLVLTSTSQLSLIYRVTGIWRLRGCFTLFWCKCRYLISQHGFFGIDAVQCTVGYHTIQAVIVRAGHNNNQFPIRFWQTTCYKITITLITYWAYGIITMITFQHVFLIFIKGK